MSNNSRASGHKAIRASMAPSQDPLAIAAQTILQAPYVKNGSIIIKLSPWFGHYVGDIELVETYD